MYYWLRSESNSLIKIWKTVTILPDLIQEYLDERIAQFAVEDKTKFVGGSGTTRIVLYRYNNTGNVHRVHSVRAYVGTQFGLTRCVCDRVQIYKNYRISHLKSCRMCNGVSCNLIRTWSCHPGADESGKILNRLKLREVEYCGLHRKYVWIYPFTTILSNILFKLPCEKVINDTCYHEILYTMYVECNIKRYRSFCGSDIHKAFASWLEFHEEDPHMLYNSTIYDKLPIRNVLGVSDSYILGAYKGHRKDLPIYNEYTVFDKNRMYRHCIGIL